MEETKVCSKCNIDQPLSEFSKAWHHKDGLSSHCNKCRKTYRESKKEAIKEYGKQRYVLKKDEISRKAKERRKLTKKQDKEKAATYYQTHKEEVKAKAKAYRETHKTERNRHNQERLARDHQYRITCNIRKRMCKLVKREFRGGNSQDWGCSREQLKNHIENTWWPGMSWANYGGATGWTIDHIIPLATFDLTKPEDYRSAVHFSNLQALWSDDNIAKGDSPNWTPARSPHPQPSTQPPLLVVQVPVEISPPLDRAPDCIQGEESAQAGTIFA